MKKQVLVRGAAAIAIMACFSGIMLVDRTNATKASATPHPNARQQATKEWQEKAARFDENMQNAKAIFAGADRVEGFRLFTKTAEKPLGKSRGYEYYAKGSTLDGEYASRLGAIILDARSYNDPGRSARMCDFEPAAGLRVISGNRYIEALICFKCSVLMTFENNPDLPVPASGIVPGRHYEPGDFDHVRPQLLTLAKEAFPKDATMQALK